jgi:hypothetical protein
MTALKKLVRTYAIVLVLLFALFAYVIATGSASKEDVFSMVFSLAMFALIPFGLVFLLRGRSKKN